MHLYWCVDCKTAGCKRRQPFKDVPLEGNTGDEPTLQLNFPSLFMLRCKTCGIAHSYTPRDIDDFQSEENISLGFEPCS